MLIHIGEKIKEVTEARGISKAELGRRLNMTSTNVHKIFKRESIDTSLLKNLSNVLEHDFFTYFRSDTNIPPELKQLYEDKIKLLEDKVRYQETEIARLIK
jgi:transcriptional regulator with XRE-family HTH domain